MRAALKVIDSTSEWSGKISSFLIYAGIFVLVYEVVARHLFNAPTIWAHGTAQRIFAFYYVIGGAYVSLYKAHVTMDLIYAKLPLRKKAILDVLTFPFFLAFCGVLLWYGSAFAWTSLSMLEVDAPPLRAPLWPVKLALPIAAFLIMLQELPNFIRNLFVAISGRELYLRGLPESVSKFG